MGNKIVAETILIHNNINILIDIGNKTEDKNYILDEKYAVSLYKSFYYPIHCLTILDEIEDRHYHLNKNLRKRIKMYNKYNSTNIDEDIYVKNTYNSLKKTLYIIGV